jgi:hypothetical protein
MNTVNVIVTYSTDILYTLVWYHSNNADLIKKVMELSNHPSKREDTFTENEYPGCYGRIFKIDPYLEKVKTPGNNFFIRSAFDTHSNNGVGNDEDTIILSKYISGEIDKLPFDPELCKWFTQVVESKLFKFEVELFRPTCCTALLNRTVS